MIRFKFNTINKNIELEKMWLNRHFNYVRQVNHDIDIKSSTINRCARFFCGKFKKAIIVDYTNPHHSFHMRCIPKVNKGNVGKVCSLRYNLFIDKIPNIE